MATPRDLWLATKAKARGANYSLRTVWEARRADIPISAAFALLEQESDFRNVFGHDPTRSIPESWKGTEVTKDKYEYYKAHRASGGMQGVGPTQLTWYGYQDAADRHGGAWIPRNTIRVGLGVFAGYFHEALKNHSVRDAVKIAGEKYNGSGPAAVAYGERLVQKYDKWHRVFT